MSILYFTKKITVIKITRYFKQQYTLTMKIIEKGVFGSDLVTSFRQIFFKYAHHSGYNWIGMLK